MADDLFKNLVDLSTPPPSDTDQRPSHRLKSGIGQLTELLDDLNRELRLNTLLEQTVNAAIQLVGAERGFLILEDETGQLDFRVASNDASRNIPDAERAASHTIIRKVLDGGEPILVNNIGDQADLKAQKSLVELNIRSVMGAPLRAGQRILGAVYVDTTRPDTIFTPEDLIIFQSFVHLAAIALENARLLEAERQARRYVQSLQEELRNILESMPLGVVLVDSLTQVQYLNRAAQEILSGVNIAVGDNLLSRGSADHPWLLQIFDNLADWLDKRVSKETEFELDRRTLNYSLFEVLRERSEVTQIGLLLEDVTENRALQRKLIESEKWSIVNQLASGIAHEIKNSLQPICGGVELLQIDLQNRGTLDPLTQGKIEVVQNAVKRIQHIVSDLNHLTKPASPNFEEIDLIEILQSVVNLMKTTTGKLKQFSSEDENARFQFRVDIPSKLPLMKGQSNAIEGVIINLLLNAVDAVQEKGGGRIQLTAGQTVEGWITVSIEDTGVGIDSRHLSRICEPYFTTKSQEGMGLGLSIVRNTMEVHGGRMEIDSKLGEGTCVRVHFPILNPVRPAE